jgi:hypothetical protein
MRNPYGKNIIGFTLVALVVIGLGLALDASPNLVMLTLFGIFLIGVGGLILLDRTLSKPSVQFIFVFDDQSPAGAWGIAIRGPWKWTALNLGMPSEMTYHVGEELRFVVSKDSYSVRLKSGQVEYGTVERALGKLFFLPERSGTSLEPDFNMIAGDSQIADVLRHHFRPEGED